MNTRRLLKLARFLEKLPPRKFNFELVVEEYNKKRACGSICCAIGWTPKVFPGLVEWFEFSYSVGSFFRPGADVASRKTSAVGYVDVATELFDLDYDEVVMLFSPYGNRPWSENYLDDDATPKQVAASIRAFIKWKRNQEAAK